MREIKVISLTAGPGSGRMPRWSEVTTWPARSNGSGFGPRTRRACGTVLQETIREKCRGVAHAHRTEISASRSELLSLHYPRHLLLLALLPACAGSQVIMRQDCSAYAEEPLHTVGLLEVAHQYSLQDMCGSAYTPAPTLHHTLVWQFKNLPTKALHRA